MTSLLEEASARLKNITGIAYEVPGVTAFVNLRMVVSTPINRIGVVFRPAHFHSAYSARHHFAFVDPGRQGRWEALLRDLGHRPLLEVTTAVSEGRVLMNGQPYTWEADEMVYWLGESPAEMGLATHERDQVAFTVAPAPPSP